MKDADKLINNNSKINLKEYKSQREYFIINAHYDLVKYVLDLQDNIEEKKLYQYYLEVIRHPHDNQRNVEMSKKEEKVKIEKQHNNLAKYYNELFNKFDKIASEFGKTTKTHKNAMTINRELRENISRHKDEENTPSGENFSRREEK